jgi:hypothetical protein
MASDGGGGIGRVPSACALRTGSGWKRGGTGLIAWGACKVTAGGGGLTAMGCNCGAGAGAGLGTLTGGKGAATIFGVGALGTGFTAITGRSIGGAGTAGSGWADGAVIALCRRTGVTRCTGVACATCP